MKKIKEGTIEADLREWLDIDVAELSEEELIAKNAKLDAFEKQVGYGVNCVFVKKRDEQIFASGENQNTFFVPLSWQRNL